MKFLAFIIRRWSFRSSLTPNRPDGIAILISENKVIPTDARTRILQAASEVTQREGAIALTLDATAREAGVSKGGLLYHFPSKEALVQGMLEYHLEAFEQAIGKSEKPFVQAYVEMGSYDGSGGLFQSLSAVLALYPELLGIVRERSRRWYAQAKSVDALVAMLATDGLFMADLMGVEAVPGNLERAVLGRLLELAKEP